MANSELLIEVSPPYVALTAMPLVILAFISYRLDLGIESPMLIGTIRTFVQLNILSFILDPIFVWGLSYWVVVALYALFMVFLSAFESSRRSKYYFDGIFWYTLVILFFHVTWISCFAFALILRPDPLWDPQYVIPIIGMLLGNCINATSLAMDTMLTSIVENDSEIELMLAFGASPYEATFRLMKQATKTGTMPQLNGMAVIGIISIPGMMTGQILGGTSVIEAARYQIMISYLIATCAFSTIISGMYFLLRICFDSRMTLRKDKLKQRQQKKSALMLLKHIYGTIRPTLISGQKVTEEDQMPLSEETSLLVPTAKLQVTTSSINSLPLMANNVLVASNVTYSFTSKGINTSLADGFDPKRLDEEDAQPKKIMISRTLFQNISLRLVEGQIAFIEGPSGVGKSTFLRLLAGMDAKYKGQISFRNQSLSTYEDLRFWRKDILYVPQKHVSIPGRPIDILEKVMTFAVRLSDTINDTQSRLIQLMSEWGLHSSLLESDLSQLSGGEAQRIMLALALALRPKILLLDESTSALDTKVKLFVENSVYQHSCSSGMSVVWITHDSEQKRRILELWEP